MSTLDLKARVLGAVLGLGDLERGEICHGFACGCVCSACVERERVPEPVEAFRFPWELAA